MSLEIGIIKSIKFLSRQCLAKRLLDSTGFSSLMHIPYSCPKVFHRISSKHLNLSVVACSSARFSAMQNGLQKYCTSPEGSLDERKFESVCTETLDSLAEQFEELIEDVPHLKNADVTYTDGVLTVNFGKKYGTYVINRQTPNLQIWLSSPTSGPKRYDFINSTWVYKHDKTTLHGLLDTEIDVIAKRAVLFVEKCSYAKDKF